MPDDNKVSRNDATLLLFLGYALGLLTWYMVEHFKH
jgi:hypothetical protein